MRYIVVKGKFRLIQNCRWIINGIIIHGIINSLNTGIGLDIETFLIVSNMSDLTIITYILMSYVIFDTRHTIRKRKSREIQQRNQRYICIIINGLMYELNVYQLNKHD